MHPKISYALRFLLLTGILVYLTIPVIDFVFNPPQGPTLCGSYKVYEKPVPSLSAWFEGTFQTDFDHYFDQQFRYQAFFIELNNQFSFTCFKETRAAFTDVGQNGYLFGTKYFNAYAGKDFIGRYALAKKISQLKILQDSLKEKGIDLIVVLAPNKTRFYKEHLPTSYSKTPLGDYNYHYLKDGLKAYAINHIDFNSWFLSLKSSYPPSALVTKYGIHWSEYGAILATDSLFRYITIKKKLPPFSIAIDSIRTSTTAEGTDSDIVPAMNLLWDMPQEKYYYPYYHFNNVSSLRKLSLLGVGDSFYWNIYNLLEHKKLLSSHEFWYYGKEIFPQDSIKPLTTESGYMEANLKHYDAVVLIVNEYNLVQLPFDLPTSIK